jgi:hypothetical protein
MNFTFRDVLTGLLFLGVCGLLVQAFLPKTAPPPWEPQDATIILKEFTNDNARLKRFEMRLELKGADDYQTWFRGKTDSNDLTKIYCYKIERTTGETPIDCNRLPPPPQPDAIHVAQHVYFADVGKKAEFLENLQQ